MDTANETKDVSSKSDIPLIRIEVETNLTTPDSNKKENEDAETSHNKDEKSKVCNVATTSGANLKIDCENAAQTESSDLTGL